MIYDTFHYLFTSGLENQQNVEYIEPRNYNLALDKITHYLQHNSFAKVLGEIKVIKTTQWGFTNYESKIIVEPSDCNFYFEMALHNEYNTRTNGTTITIVPLRKNMKHPYNIIRHHLRNYLHTELQYNALNFDTYDIRTFHIFHIKLGSRRDVKIYDLHGIINFIIRFTRANQFT
jgi:hypothetical protein